MIQDWTKLAKDGVNEELTKLPIKLQLKLLKLMEPWKLYCTKKNWESPLCSFFDFSKGIDGLNGGHSMANPQET